MPAFSASPSQQACEDQGGTYTHQNGQSTCVVTEEGKNPKFTDTTTTSGQGNTGNKTEEQQSCAPNANCPPGQFK